MVVLYTTSIQSLTLVQYNRTLLVPFTECIASHKSRQYSASHTCYINWHNVYTPCNSLWTIGLRSHKVTSLERPGVHYTALWQPLSWCVIEALTIFPYRGEWPIIECYGEVWIKPDCFESALHSAIERYFCEGESALSISSRVAIPLYNLLADWGEVLETGILVLKHKLKERSTKLEEEVF